MFETLESPEKFKTFGKFKILNTLKKEEKNRTTYKTFENCTQNNEIVFKIIEFVIL